MQSLKNFHSASINFAKILKLDFCFYRDGVPLKKMK
jgi:hypothetical protein